MRILIIGGGFGGVQTALELSRRFTKKEAIVTLISDKHHFEYTPALYKLATGMSPTEMCIPLGDIFDGTGVECIVDEITGVSFDEHVVLGASGARYRYSQLVLALGAETSFFGIPGIQENAFQIKTVETALKLKEHLHSLFFSHGNLSKGQLISQFQFVVVGGGPAGVELAGVLRAYTRTLAKMHGISEKLVTVDVIQAAPRLLPMMNEKVSALALKQLDKLGINVLLNKAVTSEDESGVHMKDISFNAKTIIWTAGVKPNHLYASMQGLMLDKSGKVLVDEHLRAQGHTDVFVIGDSAATPHAGTAQTALADAKHVAKVLAAEKAQHPLPVYRAKQTPYVVPIGHDWAIFTYKDIALAGRVFWWLREFIDFRFFLSILSLGKAYEVWRAGGTISESCPTCMSVMEARQQSS